jgi:hypothetical protein
MTVVKEIQEVSRGGKYTIGFVRSRYSVSAGTVYNWMKGGLLEGVLLPGTGKGPRARRVTGRSILDLDAKIDSGEF